MITLWQVHIAAPPVGALQVCLTCGLVLQDNTSQFDGHAAVPVGQPGGPAWWEPGSRVGHAGAVTYAIGAGRELHPEEQWCAGAN